MTTRRDAFVISFDMPVQIGVFRRPQWWKKMQRWPLTWVLTAMIWCRLTGLKKVKS